MTPPKDGDDRVTLMVPLAIGFALGILMRIREQPTPKADIDYAIDLLKKAAANFYREEP